LHTVIKLQSLTVLVDDACYPKHRGRYQEKSMAHVAESEWTAQEISSVCGMTSPQSENPSVSLRSPETQNVQMTLDVIYTQMPVGELSPPVSFQCPPTFSPLWTLQNEILPCELNCSVRFMTSESQ